VARGSLQPTTAEKCAEIAVIEAEKAKSSGTFGVGGLLIENDSRAIVKVIRNRVIRNNSVHDPTAHVERELVDWYYSSKKKLPAESKMTIITSLDPCLMCAGSILSSGFNVIHVSRDDRAGISWKGLGDFSTLPEGLEQKAKQAFSSFGVAGKRSFSGSSGSIFYGSEIDGRLDRRSVRAFSSSLKKVKKIINCHGQPPDRLAEPKKMLPKSSRVFKLLKRYNPKVFSDGHVVSFDRPGIGLGHILVQKAKESHKASSIFNSACLIDPFGNVLLAESGAQDKSPIRTPLMELARKYHQLLFEAGREGSRCLAHMKYCKTVTMLGPGQDSRSLMELGCFGSCMEGKLPKGKQLQYVIPQQDKQDLQNMLENLPPLFSSTIRIQDAILQVEDAGLVKFCKSEYALIA
jgi:tRNA(Arg) A34 adenosine deaminase TadA